MQLLAVNFHYIRDEKPSRGIYPRSIEEFQSQIEELGRYYTFLSQQELLRIIREPNGGTGERYCVITFDDNLKEQLSIYDFLERNRIPAIFFSTTYPYIEKDVHDVHKNHQIFTKYSDLELASMFDELYDFESMVFDDEQMQNSYKYDSDLMKKIKLFLNFLLTDVERGKLLDELFSLCVQDKQNFLNDFYFSKEELRMLASVGMLGTHSHLHQPLASIDLSAAKRDIEISVRFLEDFTKIKIKSISYPYGRHGAINHDVANVSRKLGLEAGFTMYRGLNNTETFLEPLMLKRIDTNDAPGGKSRSSEYYPQ